MCIHYDAKDINIIRGGVSFWVLCFVRGQLEANPHNAAKFLTFFPKHLKFTEKFTKCLSANINQRSQNGSKLLPLERDLFGWSVQKQYFNLKHKSRAW